MLDCRDLSKGDLFYECPNCDNYHLVGLSCHSRFCPNCSQKYRQQRVIEIQKKLHFVPHRHFVFTIAKELRKYFRLHRSLSKVLFDAVNLSLTDLVQKSKHAKKMDRRPGFISFLHTYERDMKFNPHIHVLVAEQTLDKEGNSQTFSYFHFARLRRFFQLALLNHMSDCL
jgi:plasmid rolling circle replication initiator protein Rep